MTAMTINNLNKKMLLTYIFLFFRFFSPISPSVALTTIKSIIIIPCDKYEKINGVSSYQHQYGDWGNGQQSGGLLVTRF
jgi:hypothetical protein